MGAWPHPVLRFEPLHWFPSDTYPATNLAEYLARLKAEGLTFTYEGSGMLFHEEWRTKTSSFTFRQLRHIIQLRYHYMDFWKCADEFYKWRGDRESYNGSKRIGTFRGEPIYRPRVWPDLRL